MLWYKSYRTLNGDGVGDFKGVLQKIDLLFLECCTVFTKCCFNCLRFAKDNSMQTCPASSERSSLGIAGINWQQIFRNGLAAHVITGVLCLFIKIPSINSPCKFTAAYWLCAGPRLTYHLPGKHSYLQAHTSCALFCLPSIIIIYTTIKWCTNVDEVHIEDQGDLKWADPECVGDSPRALVVVWRQWQKGAVSTFKNAEDFISLSLYISIAINICLSK